MRWNPVIRGTWEKVALCAALSLALVLFSSVFSVVSAQSIDNELIQDYEKTFGSSSGSTDVANILINIRVFLVRFLTVILGIASLSTLTLAAYNMFTGESSGAKRFFMWGIALVVGLVVLSVIAKMNTSAVSTEGFAGLQGSIAEVLEITLSMICMVTLVVVAVHIMNGERDGFQKFFRWLSISGVGLVLMEVIRLKT